MIESCSTGPLLLVNLLMLNHSLLALPFCSGALADLALVPELAAAAAPKPTGEVGGSVPPKGSSSGSSGGDGGKAARLPQPVDMVVPMGVGVVAVTGANWLQSFCVCVMLIPL